jgi:hypothetical protein
MSIRQQTSYLPRKELLALKAIGFTFEAILVAKAKRGNFG